ncbi:uncharacterized protein LOC117140129 [Drosophila mauritiana]|uniref:Uncharacterized protein LOC117140129 n=1 Tax=Drosophila mauritiana TaxID=7226 RepID=A0A6P8K2N8_DROMA|nr:uncharacterized protein LOC117140129 [Drosophila mauritiana]
MRVFGTIFLLAILALDVCNAVKCVLTCHTSAGDYEVIEI